MINREQFKNLPLEIKEWVGSDQVTYIISEVNKKLGMRNPFGNDIRVIPRLILRLAVKDLKPESFSNALQEELDLTPVRTQQAVQEIKERVLEPIKLPLLRWGVNINEISNFKIQNPNLTTGSQMPIPPPVTPLIPARQFYEPLKPPVPPPIPPRQYPIKPAPAEPLEEVIDLSTFQRKQRPKPQSGEQPRINGNTIDLR
jgi:hypothetical protein